MPADADRWWEALVRPSRRVADGTALLDEAQAEVLEVGPARGGHPPGSGPRAADGRPLSAQGVLPLPPYIESKLDDPDRYQTVYANQPTSVAAPTAGLHLTTEVLDRCREAGATIHTVELSVGVGTFRPLETDVLSDHQMHSERFRVSGEVMEACNASSTSCGRGDDCCACP